MLTAVRIEANTTMERFQIRSDLTTNWKKFRMYIDKNFKNNKIEPIVVQSNRDELLFTPRKRKRFGIHQNIRFILGTASYMGAFPVTNMMSADPNRLAFHWISYPTAYTFFLLFGFITIEILAVRYSMRNINQANLAAAGGFKKATSGTIFYGNACIGVYLFLKLARSWPDLIREWHNIELSMYRFGTPKVLLRFVVMTGTLMSLGFIEHMFHDVLTTRAAVKASIKEIVLNGTRKPGFYETFHIFLERYSLNSHWYLIEEESDYRVWKGLLILWLSLTATLIWNFIDLFIMLISAALAAQFTIVNRTLRKIRGRVLTESQWREYREMYANMTHLVKTVDNHINKIIAISVANNIYFICAQLITEIDSIKQDYIPSIFYLYSFLFLVARTTAVVIQAAAVHDESLKVTPELFKCPYESYCIEVQRFLQEVTSDHVSLTGLNMFSITRNFLLGIAGAILTYEIVLIQLQNTK
ncbi:gustatory receptor for sugar taste 64f-like isoform X1 [Nilaparvata lugens]|uniref:Sugar receptor Gr10 variant a n=2 Tax=Nilaparvata lugens TaxID=108931 RepID=A0A411AEP0_NILLU|nr:gustatory receptor for sugar taste 64f-like isoform X1 [Nilaparvata lugens]QAX32470.1 sugar receptor Gr10 variant a [Nilaparvata lugens]